MKAKLWFVKQNRGGIGKSNKIIESQIIKEMYNKVIQENWFENPKK